MGVQQATYFNEANAAVLGSRPVWILNRFHQPYVEDFKGKTIVIPAGERKEVTMPYLEAREFLGRGRPPATQKIDGTWDGVPKALYTHELTAEELIEHGYNPETLKRQIKAVEKEAQTLTNTRQYGANVVKQDSEEYVETPTKRKKASYNDAE